MWKIGVIGLGYWSDKHLKAWARIEGVQIAALCDLDEAKLRQKAELYGIPQGNLYTDLDDMLSKADLDVVDMITAPDTHLPFVRKIAAAGKHIMCQKPFAASMEEAREIVDTAAQANVRLMVTENWRWLKPFQTIKQLIDEDTVGSFNMIRYIHTDFYSPRFSPENELPQPFFRDMPKLLFYEMGVHWYDTWRFLFGDPKRLYAETKQVSRYIQGEDTGLVTLGYDGYMGLMDMSWATRQNLPAPLEQKVMPNHLEQLIVEGDKATIKLYSNGMIAVVDNDGIESVISENNGLDFEESHYRLQSHFVVCLDSGEEFQTSGEDNLKTLELVFGTYKSAQEHEVIHFDR
ncbi:putative dehydrogenase [Paenibacillus phyllosphaerae]|uniref:Putative dehydrogenase n=1 Tax=Paenibacillus phyllosphaerae TaxID=274593 RepID=A0A7W5B4D0_9BACL|nr:Gfo/Idh/MocA family oxidoreductase [Paenibacillus phyllosphaerae]MBB3114195.1 putative dehydrogenase [Paenibacillus phyllosphaerae]